MNYSQSLRKAAELETHLKLLIAEQKIKEALEFTCLICHEPLDVYLKTPCKHPVCKPCYLRSLESVNGNKCCMCRRIISLA